MYHISIYVIKLSFVYFLLDGHTIFFNSERSEIDGANLSKAKGKIRNNTYSTLFVNVVCTSVQPRMNFGPATRRVKYFAYDAIYRTLISRVCGIVMSWTLDCPLWICNPHKDATFSHAYPAPMQCIMQQKREPCVCATPSQHVAWSPSYFSHTFLGVHHYTPKTVRRWSTAKQSPWLTCSVISRILCVLVPCTTMHSLASPSKLGFDHYRYFSVDASRGYIDHMMYNHIVNYFVVILNGFSYFIGAFLNKTYTCEHNIYWFLHD